MKKLVLLLICLISVASYSQEKKAWAWDIDGNPLSYSGENESINMIFDRGYKDYEIFTTKSFESDGKKYEIAYQRFSYAPLFIMDFSAEGLTKKQEKNIPKVIAQFNADHKYKDINIQKNHMIEYDIKDAIEAQLTDMWFLEAIGKPDNSYQTSDGYKSYQYDGSGKKSIVLMFENGVVKDYRIHGGL